MSIHIVEFNAKEILCYEDVLLKGTYLFYIIML